MELVLLQTKVFVIPFKNKLQYLFDRGTDRRPVLFAVTTEENQMCKDMASEVMCAIALKLGHCDRPKIIKFIYF